MSATTPDVPLHPHTDRWVFRSGGESGRVSRAERRGVYGDDEARRACADAGEKPDRPWHRTTSSSRILTLRSRRVKAFLSLGEFAHDATAGIFNDYVALQVWAGTPVRGCLRRLLGGRKYRLTSGMTKIDLTINFAGDDGAVRSETRSFSSAFPADLSGEHRVAHNLFADLGVAVGDLSTPKHNETARKWIEFPNKPTRMQQYFDVRNSQAVWIELANLIMGLEADLILARAYKALEPAQEPSIDDEDGLNDLYYVHDRKLTLLNQAVHALIKVQDIINRLLHESLGGDLVDTTDPEWESYELRRKNIIKGLDAKRAAGSLSQSDYDAITAALKIPRNTPKGEITRTYRNRLAHQVRPSVDYSMFFANLESRVGQEIKDAQGNVIGRRFPLLSRPPAEYQFKDLDQAFSEYLDAVVAMLEKLSALSILRRQRCAVFTVAA